MPEEKVVTVNLRKKIVKYPRWKRSSRVVRVLKEILEKNIKGEVKLSDELNRKIWERSAQKPPMKIRVKLTKIEEGKFKAELLK